VLTSQQQRLESDVTRASSIGGRPAALRYNAVYGPSSTLYAEEIELVPASIAVITTVGLNATDGQTDRLPTDGDITLPRQYALQYATSSCASVTEM